MSRYASRSRGGICTCAKTETDCAGGVNPPALILHRDATIIAPTWVRSISFPGGEITDALPLILERPRRRREVLPPPALAIVLRGLQGTQQRVVDREAADFLVRVPSVVVEAHRGKRVTRRRSR